MKLVYTGVVKPDTTIQLPEGWPAVDHDERDEALFEAKIASGYYRAVTRKNVKTVKQEESNNASD